MWKAAWGPGAHVFCNAPKYNKTPVTACMAAAASGACLIQPLPYSAAAAAGRCEGRGGWVLEEGGRLRRRREGVLKRNAVDLVDAEYVGAG